MIQREVINRVSTQFACLREISISSHDRLARADDDLFRNHANVFVKSYIVSACTILECFLADLACEYVLAVEERVKHVHLPRNIVLWRVPAQIKPSEFRFEPFTLNIERKEIVNESSGNFYKTITLFNRLGIDLLSNNKIKLHKDFVASAIDKRNKIVHENDEALDITFLDVVEWINRFEAYAMDVFSCVNSSPYC